MYKKIAPIMMIIALAIPVLSFAATSSDVMVKDTGKVKTEKTHKIKEMTMKQKIAAAKQKAAEEKQKAADEKAAMKAKAAEKVAKKESKIQNTVNTTPAVSDGQNGPATAMCNDGTKSYATTHTGSCSGHGGVKAWLDGTPN